MSSNPSAELRSILRHIGLLHPKDDLMDSLNDWRIRNSHFEPEHTPHRSLRELISSSRSSRTGSVDSSQSQSQIEYGKITRGRSLTRENKERRDNRKSNWDNRGRRSKSQFSRTSYRSTSRPRSQSQSRTHSVVSSRSRSSSIGSSVSSSRKKSYWNMLLKVGQKDGPNDFLMVIDSDKFDSILESVEEGNLRYQTAIDMFNRAFDRDLIKLDEEYFFTDIIKNLRRVTSIAVQHAVIVSWIKPFIPEHIINIFEELAHRKTLESELEN